MTEEIIYELASLMGKLSDYLCKVNLELHKLHKLLNELRKNGKS